MHCAEQKCNNNSDSSSSTNSKMSNKSCMPCNLNRIVGFNNRLSFRLSELMHDMKGKREKEIPCRRRDSLFTPTRGVVAVSLFRRHRHCHCSQHTTIHLCNSIDQSGSFPFIVVVGVVMLMLFLFLFI